MFMSMYVPVSDCNRFIPVPFLGKTIWNVRYYSGQESCNNSKMWHVSYLVPHLTSFENSNLNHPNYCSSLKSMNSVHTHLHGKTHVCFFEPSPEPIMTWRKCQELQRTGPPHQPSLSVWYHQPSTSTQTQFSPRGCSGGPTTFKNSPWYFPWYYPMTFPWYSHCTTMISHDIPI